MSLMASQITSITSVYSTVNSGADERKHHTSASLAFVRGIHWWRVNSRKIFHLMTSSCNGWYLTTMLMLVIRYKEWCILPTQMMTRSISTTWPSLTKHSSKHDAIIKWKNFPRHWPFVRRIHRSQVNSSYKGQWRGALIFSSIYALNKRLNKQPWGRWFETPSRSLWRHCNDRVGPDDTYMMRWKRDCHGSGDDNSWTDDDIFSVGPFVTNSRQPKFKIRGLSLKMHFKCRLRNDGPFVPVSI